MAFENGGQSSRKLLNVSNRMQQWSLTLLAYDYELVYRPGLQNGSLFSMDGP